MPRLRHCHFGHTSRQPHQRELASIILQHLSPGCGAVDVGMMWGWAAWHMLYAVRAAGRVWGIDPVPEHCEWVRERFPTNLKIVQCHASNGYHAPPLRAEKLPSDMPMVHRRIDDIVDSAVHLIKIDTDHSASDLASLEGARQTISKWRPVITVQGFNADISEFMQYCGYSCDNLSQRYDRVWRPKKQLTTSRIVL